jgi:hypothetical protein
VWEKASEAQALAEGRLPDPVFGDVPIDEPKPSLSSLKDLLVSQGRRIETLNAELSTKRDSAPLKFSPKKSQNFKPED